MNIASNSWDIFLCKILLGSDVPATCLGFIGCSGSWPKIGQESASLVFYILIQNANGEDEISPVRTAAGPPPPHLPHRQAHFRV